MANMHMCIVTGGTICAEFTFRCDLRHQSRISYRRRETNRSIQLLLLLLRIVKFANEISSIECDMQTGAQRSLATVGKAITPNAILYAI